MGGKAGGEHRIRGAQHPIKAVSPLKCMLGPPDAPESCSIEFDCFLS